MNTFIVVWEIVQTIGALFGLYAGIQIARKRFSMQRDKLFRYVKSLCEAA